MMEAKNEKQVKYEQQRHERLLGLAINTAINGAKSILIYGDPGFWSEADRSKWETVKSDAESIVLQLMALEDKILTLANVYVSFKEETK
jgi:hypothetical protein